MKRKGPKAKPPLAAAVAYTSTLWDYLDRVNAWILEVVLEGWATNPAHGYTRRDALRSTFVVSKVHQLKIGLAEKFPPPAEGIRTVAARVSKKGSLEFQRVIGVGTRDLGVSGPTLDAFRDRNVSLIKSLVDRQLTDLASLLQEAESQALRVEELRNRIQERFDVTKSKAQLLARDQVLKFNGQLTEARQTGAGITHYTWSTSNDERVREMHAELDGTVHAWNNPPVISADGRRGHPGDDYQCRCVAIPELDEVDRPEYSGEGSRTMVIPDE